MLIHLSLLLDQGHWVTWRSLTVHFALQISELIKETEAGGDYRIDHSLYVACEPVVQTVCKDKVKKDGDVMWVEILLLPEKGGGHGRAEWQIARTLSSTRANVTRAGRYFI